MTTAPRIRSLGLSGAAAGLGHGELQGALGSLKTVCSLVMPAFWSWLYAVGLKAGSGRYCRDFLIESRTCDIAVGVVTKVTLDKMRIAPPPVLPVLV